MHTFINQLSRFFALVGGATLTLLILLICASVFGRSVNGILHGEMMQSVLPGFAAWALGTGVGPINGDFEIVEAAMAFAIFAFLPICQLQGAHASVDVFTSRFSPRADRVLRLVIEVTFAAALILLAYYLTLGGLSKQRSGQTTLLLQFPTWWSYAASIIAMWFAALVGVYVAWMRGVELATGRSGLVQSEGAEH